MADNTQKNEFLDLDEEARVREIAAAEAEASDAGVTGGAADPSGAKKADGSSGSAAAAPPKEPAYDPSDKRAPAYNEGIARLKQGRFIVEPSYSVKNFEEAAKLFHSAAGFRDADKKEKECRENAKKAKEADREATYQKAVTTLAESRISDDYNRAKNLFSALDGYKDSEERIKDCQAGMTRAAVKRHRNQVIAIAIIAAILTGGFYAHHIGIGTYLVGSLYGAGGMYQEASDTFASLGSLLNSEERAESYREKELAVRAHQEEQKIKKLKVGDTVPFGDFEWTIAAKDTEAKTVTLVLAKADSESIFYRVAFNDTGEDAKWLDSSLCGWLNGEVLDDHFTEDEQKRMIPDKNGLLIHIPSLDEVKELSTAPFRKLSRDLWLSDDGENEGTEMFLTAAGNTMRFGAPVDNQNLTPCPVITVSYQ